jgi:hypothetical protein
VSVNDLENCKRARMAAMISRTTIVPFAILVLPKHRVLPGPTASIRDPGASPLILLLAAIQQRGRGSGRLHRNSA